MVLAATTEEKLSGFAVSSRSPIRPPQS